MEKITVKIYHNGDVNNGIAELTVGGVKHYTSDIRTSLADKSELTLVTSRGTANCQLMKKCAEDMLAISKESLLEIEADVVLQEINPVLSYTICTHPKIIPLNK